MKISPITNISNKNNNNIIIIIITTTIIINLPGLSERLYGKGSNDNGDNDDNVTCFILNFSSIFGRNEVLNVKFFHSLKENDSERF
jgi:hypothetical protein